MIRAFRSNGIRFYPVNSLLQPTGNRFNDLPYSLQRIPHQAQNICRGTRVWFDDVVHAQFVSSATALQYIVSSASGANLQQGPLENLGAFDGAIFHWATINLASIAGLNDGSQILIFSNTLTERLLSEPLVNDPDRTIKIVYSNFGDHYDYGSYRRCKEMVHYCRAQLIEHILPSEHVTYQDARGRFRKLVHSHHDGRLLQSESLTWYEASILHAALNHDKITIFENKNNRLVSSRYEPLNDELLGIERPINPYQGYTASIPLLEVDTYVRRLPFAQPQAAALLVTILPETNITASSFTANWQAVADADFYQIQLSTTQDFSVIAQSGQPVGNSFNFAGLTACAKYFYRIRASICGVFTPWATNVTEQRRSLHFRGRSLAAVSFFDEKIIGLAVNNILARATNIRYKIAAGNVALNSPLWGAEPFLTLTQLQANIDLQPATYTIRTEITNYAQGSDAVVELVFNTAAFYLTVGCNTYDFANRISQDILVGATRRMSIDSLTLTNGATVLGYELITSPAQAVVNFNQNLAALNVAIAALLPGQNYAVGIFVSSQNTIMTLNVSYL